MPGQRFTVQLNPDDLALNALVRPADDDTAGHKSVPGAKHHGAQDERQAARQRSGRDRAGRAAGASGGRSYAFRRS